MSDLTKALGQYYQPAAPEPVDAAPLSPGGYNPWSAAGKEFMFAMGPGMLGLQSKDPEVVAFQQDYPKTSTAIDIAGFMTPYGLWGKMASKIPMVGKALDAVASADRIAEAPFKAGAMKELVRFGPLEAGRLASSALLGDALADALDAYNLGTTHVAKEALINLSLGGFVGGAFEKLASGGGIFRSRRTDIAPGANLDDPVQLQIRDMQRALQNKEIDDVLVPDTLAQIETLKRRVLEESAKQNGSKVEAVRAFTSATATDKNQARQQVNRLWKVNDSPEAKIGTFKLLPSSLAKIGATTEVIAARAGLPENWEAFVQLPRLKVAGKTAGAKAIQADIQKYFDPVDAPNLYVAREGDDGLYIMAKKINGGPAPDKGDQWLVFKTDSPGKFAPAREDWARLQLQRNAWLLDDSDVLKRGGIGAPIFDDAVRFNDDIRAADYRAMASDKGNLFKLAEYLGEKVGVKVGNNESLRQAALFAKQYLAPAMHQFTDSPLAAKLFSTAKLTFERAGLMANELFYGETKLASNSPLRTIASSMGEKVLPEGSINNLVDKLYAAGSEAVERFWMARQQMLSVEEAAKKLKLGQPELALLKELQRVDDLKNAQTAAVEQAVGMKSRRQFAPAPGHYMISNRWRGDNRVPVVTENGRLIAVGGGVSRQEAIKAAEAMAARAKDFGIDARLLKPVLRGELSADKAYREQIARALAQDARVRTFYEAGPSPLWNPARFKEARGVKGFIGEEKPWTKEELKENILSTLKEDFQRQAKMTVDRILSRQMAALDRMDPSSYKQFMDRLRQMEGKQGALSRGINDLTDRVMGPFIGKNSASKIVGATNNAMFGLTLGFGNLGYALTNLLTFTQTALPHIAFLTTAAPQRVARYYTYWPVKGAARTDAVGVFDILKLTRDSFKLLGNPKAMLGAGADEFMEHFRLATKDGVWDPKFVEDFVGETALTKAKLRATLQGTEGFSNFIKAVSEFTPGLSEKFGRGHTFVLGWLFGKKMAGFEGEKLYHFAKEFTEKTQFNYSAADRPMVITGPFGTAVGLFKNWMMHYIGWWLEYMGEGMAHGNWKPLLWMGGATTTAGGIGALPFIEPIDSLTKMMSDKSLMQHTYSTFGGDKDGVGMGDAVYYGLPALLGFSLQGQVTMPFSDPGQTATQLFSLAYLDRMKAFSRTVGDVYDNAMATGTHPANDARVLDGLVRTFAPKSIYRAASVDWEDGGLRSLTTGNTLIDSLPPAQRVLYTLGLNPRTVEMGFKVADELWKDQAKNKAIVTKLGQQWAAAAVKGDFNTMQRLIVDAVVNGVDVSSVLRSGKAYMAKGQEAQIERQFSPEALYEYRMLNLVP